MRFLEKKLLLLSIILLSIAYFCGCTVGNTVNNESTEVDDQAATKKSDSNNTNNVHNNVVYENLINLNEKLKDPNTNSNDIASITEQFIDGLQEYLRNPIDIESLRYDFGINIISKTLDEKNMEINLLIYDGNAIGLGTLERTWTFLQITINQNIELYQLYNQAAEYPLDMKILENENDKYIISIIGATNISRDHTLFLSFWEYSNKKLNEFTDIKLESYKSDDSINGNEYFMECYEDTNLNFTASSNNFGFFDIEGSTFVLNSSFINNEVIIKVFK